MVGRHKCLGVKEDGSPCRKFITYRFAICRDCEEIYGTRAVEWPDWLRFIWNDIQRERRKRRAWNMSVLPIDLDEDTFDADQIGCRKISKYRPSE